MNSVEEILEARRSLRRYSSEPVTEDERKRILRAAMHAPTAGNMMLYTIIEVADQSLKEKLVETCDGQPFIANAPLVLLYLADHQRWHDFYVRGDVPEMCSRHDVPWREPAESELMLSCCDALIAAQNSVIAAESMGIGSCYVGDIMERFEMHREMFELPRWTLPIALVCYGHYPEGERPAARGRLPEDLVVHRDRYRPATEDDFSLMEERRRLWSISRIHEPAKNTAQRMYLRKTGAPFSAEMARSLRVAMRRWIGKEK